jgi:hypothetical protein
VKAVYVTITILLLLAVACGGQGVKNNKDLDDNMLDMMMYHDNLGLFLRKGDADYASWLLEGMDSSLQVISQKFTTHRKLRDPFAGHYEKLLKPPISAIRASLKKNNIPEAIIAYKQLTKNCNSCHANHDVNKEVFDRTLPE